MSAGTPRCWRRCPARGSRRSSTPTPTAGSTAALSPTRSATRWPRASSSGPARARWCGRGRCRARTSASTTACRSATSDAKGRLVLLERSTGRVLRLHLGTGRFRTYATVPDLPACPPGAGPDGCSPNLTDEARCPTTPPGAATARSTSPTTPRPCSGGSGPAAARREPWFADARLDGILFGTAGLRLTPDRRALMFTQQVSAEGGTLTQGKLYRLPIRKGRPGELELVWQSMPTDLPDGFGFGRRTGNIYLANAGLTNQIVVLSPEGEELERFPEVPVLRGQRARRSPSTPRPTPPSSASGSSSPTRASPATATTTRSSTCTSASAASRRTSRERAAARAGRP